MRKTSTLGAANVFLIVSIVLLVFLIGAVGFATWSFTGYQDYKSNYDLKLAEQNQKTIKDTEARKDAEFLEKEKEPLKAYKGPNQYGTLTIKYPKTWSAYIDDQNNTSSAPVMNYFHPDVVPVIGRTTAYALTVKVTSEEYDDIVRQYDDRVKRGLVTVTPYTVNKVPSVNGVRIDGQITEDKKGSMVLVRLRDKRLILTCQSEQYMKDFNDIILKNYSFIP